MSSPRDRPAAPTTPHDALIKTTFSRVEHAAALLRQVLPSAIVKRLDFSTLTCCPGSFVDSKLAARHTDLLFSVKLSGRPVFLYLLFEHQSRVDPLMAFRLLEYMVRIWEDHLRKHPGARRLPAILPVVLHHSETGWRADVTFEALLDLDPDTLAAVAEYVPRFRFVLDDISAEPDEALRQRPITALGKLVLWCLRHSRAPDKLVQRLPEWADLVREVRAAPDGVAVLAAIWRYILAVSDRKRPEEVLARLLAAVEEEDAREDIMNVADQLREEGRLKGLAEGKREGKREGLAEGQRKGLAEGQRSTLLRLLRARFGALPADVTARVRAAGAAQLDVWTERVLTAPTLSAVLGET